MKVCQMSVIADLIRNLIKKGLLITKRLRVRPAMTTVAF